MTATPDAAVLHPRTAEAVPQPRVAERRVGLLFAGTGIAVFAVMGLFGLTMRLTQATVLSVSPSWFYRLMTVHGAGMLTGALLAMMGAPMLSGPLHNLMDVNRGSQGPGPSDIAGTGLSFGVSRVIAPVTSGGGAGGGFNPLAPTQAQAYSAGQRKEVQRYLTPEVAGEARLVAGGPGGELPERGYYVTPTVYSDVDPGAPLAQEEVFGPVLSILAADSDDHAIEIANNSIYGLGGALWIGDTGRALEYAARIRTGQIDVNAAPFNPRAPFGGYKQSGVGREIGGYGLDDVLEVKAVQL